MSSDDADDERESLPQTPVADWVDPRTLRFTVFIVLPNDEVCTLRNLPSGITVFDVKGRLELHAGIPSQIYSLVYPDGEELADDQKLLVQENILHGYLLRVQLQDTWEPLYTAIIKNNIEHVYHGGGVHLKGNIVVGADDRDRYESMVKERGAVALYLAAYQGQYRMVNMLLSVGVSVHSATCFGRRPIHAAAARDHMVVLDLLLNQGATINQTDCFGVTALDIAKNFSSNLCTKRLRLLHLNLRGNASKNVSPRKAKSDLRNSGTDSRGTSSCTFRDTESALDTLRTRSTLSQYSDMSSHRHMTTPLFKRSRTFVSSSASKTDHRKHLFYSPQSARFSQNDESRNSADVKGDQPKRSVKWKDVPTDNAYWNVIELTNVQKSSVADAVNIKPIAIIQPKKILKFGKGTEEKQADTEENPSQSKSPEPEVLKKAVRFTQERLKYFSSLSKKPDDHRSMRKKINLAASQKKPNENDSEAYKKWIEKKEQEEEESHESDDSELYEFNVSDTEGDRLEEFNKTVRKMNRIKTKYQTPGNRPVTGLVEIGSTQHGDGTNPSADENIAAYRAWRRRKRYEGKMLVNRKTIGDYMAERQRLEERRQKLLMNAITYDEWMDHAEERKFLIQQILQADNREMKRLEQEKFTERIKLYSYDIWKEKIKKREEEDRKRKAIQRRYDEDARNERMQLGKSTAAVSFDVWKKKKSEAMKLERQKTDTSEKKNDKQKRDLVEVESAYEHWLMKKHNEEMRLIESQIEHDKVLNTRSKVHAQLLQT